MLHATQQAGSDPAVSTLLSAIRRQESHLHQHSRRVATLALHLGRRLSLDQTSLLALSGAALLHDLGKFLVPHAILNKPGPLTRREWDIMQEHPLLSQQLCEALPWLNTTLPIIRAHHERLDGSDYPDGLVGSQIPLLAQIVQLADVSDALLSARSYKPALPLARVIEILHDEARRGWGGTPRSPRNALRRCWTPLRARHRHTP